MQPRPTSWRWWATLEYDLQPDALFLALTSSPIPHNYRSARHVAPRKVPHVAAVPPESRRDQGAQDHGLSVSLLEW